jgi:hypothetical protein
MMHPTILLLLCVYSLPWEHVYRAVAYQRRGDTHADTQTAR